MSFLFMCTGGKSPYSAYSKGPAVDPCILLAAELLPSCRSIASQQC